MKPVLIVNDLHIPFQREDILTMIKRCSNRLEAIIFGGDIIDCKAISKFPDLDDITIEFEIESAINFIRQVREIVGDKVKLIVIKGNHELRWERYIARMHDKKLYKFINPNVLTMLKEGMNVFENGTSRYVRGDSQLIVVDSWYINYKGIIVCHPTNYYSQPCKNSIQACNFFIDKENFDVLVCGHNHHQSTCYYLGKWLIESGCCCKHMKYMESKTTAKMEDFGFVYIVFDKKNKVDINSSFVYHLV